MNTVKQRDKKYRIMVILASITAIIIILFAIKMLSNPKRIAASKTGFALDTVVSITLYGKGDNKAVEELLRLCSYYEDTYFSPTKPQSELYAINHAVWTIAEQSLGKSKVIELSEDMYNVMRQALKYYDLTNGSYNIAVKPITELWDFHNPDKAVIPDSYELNVALENIGSYGPDFKVEKDYKFTDADGIERHYLYALILNKPITFDIGSVAKGYIADRIREKAYSEGLNSILIDLGGNICCGELKRGLFSGKPGFKIGIDTSFLADTKEKQTVTVNPGSCVVTSGKYMRCFDKDGRHYHHIIDSATGYPVETDLASVTVIGPCSAECDVLSTVSFILGEERAAEIIEKEGYEAVFIYDNGSIHRY